MKSLCQRRRNLLPLLGAAVVFASSGAAATQSIFSLPDDPLAHAAREPASPSVKSGMAAIRRLAADAHTLITHRRFAPDQARRFSAAIGSRVEALKTDPAASQALKDVLTLLAEGAAQVGEPVSGDSQLEGLVKIETALNRYPQLFEDAGWQPLR